MFVRSVSVYICVCVCVRVWTLNLHVKTGNFPLARTSPPPTRSPIPTHHPASFNLLSNLCWISFGTWCSVIYRSVAERKREREGKNERKKEKEKERERKREIYRNWEREKHRNRDRNNIQIDGETVKQEQFFGSASSLFCQ